jgi:hypothetical protein
MTRVTAEDQRMSERLCLEDLLVGQRFVSAAREVLAAEIVEFAARYDPQPFHLDDAAATDTLFGGLAASGWHTRSDDDADGDRQRPDGRRYHRHRWRAGLAATDAARECVARGDRGAGDHIFALSAGAGDGGHALYYAEPAG